MPNVKLPAHRAGLAGHVSAKAQMSSKIQITNYLNDN